MYRLIVIDIMEITMEYLLANKDSIKEVYVYNHKLTMYPGMYKERDVILKICAVILTTGEVVRKIADKNLPYGKIELKDSINSQEEINIHEETSAKCPKSKAYISYMNKNQVQDLIIIPHLDKNKRKILAISDDEFFPAGWWYLHGKIQARVGFDLAVISNFKSALQGAPHIDGVVTCKVYHNGKYLSCIGYFWIDCEQHQRGLVCLKHDIEAREDAYKKMSQKVCWL